MNHRYKFYFLAFAAIASISSCSEDKKPVATVPAPKKPEVMAPFRYHELIEVSPGQDYDILSWGRGGKSASAFEILHSDSAAAKYTTTTGDLDGDIVDAYNSDMDLDGNPEIIIQAKGKDSTNYTNVYAFEFLNNRANKLDFPRLTKSQRSGYRGKDNFYIKDGKLIREFPIYEGAGKEAKATGQKRQFEYGLRGNEFTVKQLGKDSTSNKTTTQVAQKEPEKKKEPEKTQETKKEKKKSSSSSEKKKKKKKHHHHSGE